MPKRTNEFQQLIKLIEKQLSSKDISIEESKFLEDFRTGRQREVDIYLETKIFIIINDFKRYLSASLFLSFKLS